MTSNDLRGQRSIKRTFPCKSYVMAHGCVWPLYWTFPHNNKNKNNFDHALTFCFRAQFRENRSIFNTPNPRLMNVSLMKDSKFFGSRKSGKKSGSESDPRGNIDVSKRQQSIAAAAAAAHAFHVTRAAAASGGPPSRGASVEVNDYEVVSGGNRDKLGKRSLSYGQPTTTTIFSPCTQFHLSPSQCLFCTKVSRVSPQRPQPLTLSTWPGLRLHRGSPQSGRLSWGQWLWSR